VGKKHYESAIRIRANYDGATNSAASFTSTDSWHELLGWDFRHEQVARARKALAAE
jgi:hypothetical protein